MACRRQREHSESAKDQLQTPNGSPVDLEVCDADLTIRASKDEFLRISAGDFKHIGDFVTVEIETIFFRVPTRLRLQDPP